MIKLAIVLTSLFVFRISVFAQMSDGHSGGMMGNDHGGGMMNSGWGWGMNSGWLLLIVIVILVIFGVVYMMKRK